MKTLIELMGDNLIPEYPCKLESISDSFENKLLTVQGNGKYQKMFVTEDDIIEKYNKAIYLLNK